MTDVVNEDAAVALLAAGKVVAVPTDTVYGVGASLAHPAAVEALFALKRRPGSVALPILVASIEQIEALGASWPERARQLASSFWPGALTIVVPGPPGLASVVGGSSQTAGFRIPNDAQLRGVLARSGALAVTSANEHGGPPCQSAAQVRSAFAGHDGLAGVVDGGTRNGRVSTVVEISGSTWRILREGAVATPEIAAVLERGAATAG